MGEKDDIIESLEEAESKLDDAQRVYETARDAFYFEIKRIIESADLMMPDMLPFSTERDLRFVAVPQDAVERLNMRRGVRVALVFEPKTAFVVGDRKPVYSLADFESDFIAERDRIFPKPDDDRAAGDAAHSIRAYMRAELGVPDSPLGFKPMIPALGFVFATSGTGASRASTIYYNVVGGRILVYAKARIPGRPTFAKAVLPVEGDGIRDAVTLVCKRVVKYLTGDLEPVQIPA